MRIEQTDSRSTETERSASPASGRRKKLGGNGAAWSGVSIALLMAMRSITPLMRSTGPAGRHIAILLVLAGVPLTVGVQVYRRRAEKREAEARAARAKARLSRSEIGRKKAEPGEAA